MDEISIDQKKKIKIKIVVVVVVVVEMNQEMGHIHYAHKHTNIRQQIFIEKIWIQFSLFVCFVCLYGVVKKKVHLPMECNQCFCF